MFGLQPMHLVVILAVLVLILGPGRLPEVGAGVGRAIRGFQDEVQGRKATVDAEDRESA